VAAGRLGLLAAVDYGDRECVGYRLALRVRAQEAIETLDAACASRFPNRVEPADLELRTDNGSAFGAASFVAEEECAWQHQFESFAAVERVITEWIRLYKEQRPHSTLGYLAPKEYHQRQGERGLVA